MLYCNLQVFFCTEIAVGKHFDPSKCDFWRGLGGLKKILASLSLAIFYGPLINYDVIRPLKMSRIEAPQQLASWVELSRIGRYEQGTLGLGLGLWLACPSVTVLVLQLGCGRVTPCLCFIRPLFNNNKRGLLGRGGSMRSYILRVILV